jgi:hypothetical protein
MVEKTSELILKIAAQIEEVLNKNPIAAPNDFVPVRIRFLASHLGARDHYAAEKVFKIAELATIFYSARKHTKYRGGSDALWVEMTYDLINRIRSQANTRNAHGD